MTSNGIISKMKKNWKVIVIIILSILFVSNCTGRGNYKRKYNSQVERTVFVQDSVESVYTDAKKKMDSLSHVIEMRDIEIRALENEVSIYKEQNTKLASKPVVVKVDNKTKNE